MRILIDACVNPRVRQAFPDHDVVTAAEANWRAVRDHKLVDLASGRIDVLVTIDRGFEYEQNLQKLTFGIVIVHVRRNRIEYYRPLFEQLRDAVDSVRPGQVVHVRDT